jgi:hypothetical protein
VFAAVKQEASLYSIRQKNKEGESMFESLVFDEAYLIKFRELFFNAQAQITPILAAYKKDDGSGFFERKDFSKNRDFTCHLCMPENFNEHMARPLEDHIFNFLKDWIMYKWLETKATDTAAIFAANCEGYKSDIRTALNSRRVPILRAHGYY